MEGLGHDGNDPECIECGRKRKASKGNAEPVELGKHDHDREVGEPETEKETGTEEKMRRLERKKEIQETEEDGPAAVTCVKAKGRTPDGGLPSDDRRDLLHSLNER